MFVCMYVCMYVYMYTYVCINVCASVFEENMCSSIMCSFCMLSLFSNTLPLQGWTFLAEIASRVPKLMDSHAVLGAWTRGRGDGSCSPLVLTVLGFLALSATAAERLCGAWAAGLKRKDFGSSTTRLICIF